MMGVHDLSKSRDGRALSGRLNAPLLIIQYQLIETACACVALLWRYMQDGTTVCTVCDFYLDRMYLNKQEEDNLF